MEKHQIRLIVIDSIAWNLRVNDTVESTPVDVIQRAKCIYDTLTQLKHLAVTFNAAVICINEMTASFSAPIPIANSSMPGSQYYYNNEDQGWDTCNSPALGQAFAVCVNTRCQFEKIRTVAGPTRTMHLLYSTKCPKAKLGFEVNNEGLRGQE